MIAKSRQTVIGLSLRGNKATKTEKMKMAAKKKKSEAFEMPKAELERQVDRPVADPKKEGIPVELQVQNRKFWKKPDAETQAKIDAHVAESRKIVPFDKPKGMSDEEYQAMKSRERQKK